LPNVIKIDLYNFELYRCKVGAFFLKHSVRCARLEVWCVLVAFKSNLMYPIVSNVFDSAIAAGK